MEEEEGEAGCMSRAAMVTVIHVVDTLEPTQSLPPVAAIPRSACLSTASLRAWQGHGAVSYYKRRSPSLLQETQTHQSPVHPPHTHTPQYPSSSINYICWGGLGDNTEAQSGQGTLKLFVFFFCHLILEMFMFICQRPRQQSTPALRIYHLFRTK